MLLGLAAMDGGISGITDTGNAAELENVRKRREHALCLSVRGPFRSGAGVPGSSANWFRAAGRDRSIHGSRASAPISGRRCARAAVCKAASTRIFLAGLSFSHANIFASDSESLLMVWYVGDRGDVGVYSFPRHTNTRWWKRSGRPT